MNARKRRQSGLAKYRDDLANQLDQVENALAGDLDNKGLRLEMVRLEDELLHVEYELRKLNGEKRSPVVVSVPQTFSTTERIQELERALEPFAREWLFEERCQALKSQYQHAARVLEGVEQQ